VHWGELMFDAAEVRKRFGEENLLEWNLRILQQVCNAVHFAHSHKIIHRDLKPENVMIGEFGEVYVLDWGLAVSLVDDGTGRLPLVSETNKLAGTPCYMAPETIEGVNAPLSERTDIYLLGSILFEIMTGHPPHMGETQEEIVASVLRSYPDIPVSAPSELARICRRAMLPDPSRRYRSADQLRNEINRFIQHQGSTRLEVKAQERLDELLEALSAKNPEQPDSSQHLYNLFGECRFAYRQAAELWSENEAAIRGLRRATEAMVEYELGRGEVGAAATLMAELDKPSAELQQRMRDAVAARQKEQQRIAKLEVMGRQLDMGIGQGRRTLGAVVLGVSWTVSPLLGHYVIERLGWSDSHWPPIAALAALLVVIAAVRWFGRADLMETAISRRLLGAAFVAIFSTIVIEVAAIIGGISVPLSESLWPFGWFCVSAILAITVDRRLIPMTLGFVATLFATAAWPDWRFHAMTVSSIFATINMFYVWMPRNGSPPAGGKELL
jgi:eukaryotic-like serine/threonine-protein kinase